MEPRSSRKSSASAAPASALQIDIARRVLEMIRSGLVKAGDHLTEESLAKTYGVSRTPVRHALRLLQEQGLVEVRANAGTFVAESAADAAEASVQGAATVLAPPDEGEDNLYKRILADRASHQLPQSLSESALAARYGAPRGTLRRTLLRLTREGLIELGHPGGDGRKLSLPNDPGMRRSA
jgi:DNA-binding GntR family transcriptional regulator